MDSKSFGTYGEKLAVEHLNKVGLILLVKNYRTANGEIDIIAQSKNTLHFIEVKSSRNQIQAGFSLHSKKQNQIHRVAKYFLKKNLYFRDFNFQFDAILIHKKSEKYSIDYYDKAFVPEVLNYF